jgi:hypothetical protein
MSADCDRLNGIERLQKLRVAQCGVSKARVAQVDAAQVRLANLELMKVEPGQGAAQGAQQR